MTHEFTAGEIIALITAVGNIGAWGFYAGRLVQLTRDIADRVDKLEKWRDNH